MRSSPWEILYVPPISIAWEMGFLHYNYLFSFASCPLLSTQSTLQHSNIIPALFTCQSPKSSISVLYHRLKCWVQFMWLQKTDIGSDQNNSYLEFTHLIHMKTPTCLLGDTGRQRYLLREGISKVSKQIFYNIQFKIK